MFATGSAVTRTAAQPSAKPAVGGVDDIFSKYKFQGRSAVTQSGAGGGAGSSMRRSGTVRGVHSRRVNGMAALLGSTAGTW